MTILETVDRAPFRRSALLTRTGPSSAACNLVDVGISRARCKLALIADVPYFRTMAPTSAVTEMVDQASSSGLHVALPLPT